MRIDYTEAQEKLKQLIDEGDPDEVVSIFEFAFARIKGGTASFDGELDEIEFEDDPEYADIGWGLN